MSIFIIQDTFHGAWCGRFVSFEDALDELKIYIKISWGEEPNIPPCAGWEKCHRDYEIIEYDDSNKPWKEVNRIFIFKISSHSIVENKDYIET